MLRFSAIAALAVLASSALRAQTADSTTLARVVVTATRVASPLGGGIASVTVLHGDSLRARGISDLAEALREVPGAAPVRSGSYGSQTAFFLRGGENDYVQFLVDGVPINDPGGAIDLATWTLEDVERIEIVRGPASVLYGSDAVTGVVQVFTRRHGGRTSAGAAVSGGSHGRQTAEFSLGAGRAGSGVVFSGARRRSDGILPFNNEYANDLLGGTFTLAPGRGFRAALSAREQRDEFHFPTDGGGRLVDRNAARFDRRRTLALDAEQSFLGRFRAQLTISALDGRPRTDDAPDNAADTSGFHAYRSEAVIRRRVADLRLHYFAAAPAVITLGHQWLRESQRGRDSSNFDAAPNAFSAERTTRATYLQLVGERGPLSATLGARHDDNDVFGSFRTARGGLALRLGAHTTLRASAGTAFKAPTFLEQFNTAFTVGNPDLRPERARSIETGITRRFGLGELTATWFTQRFRDLIQYSFVEVNRPNYFNVAEASSRGFELEGRVRAGTATMLSGSSTWLRTRVEDAGLDRERNATFVRGERLLRRPAFSATLAARSRLTSRLTLDGRLLYVGSRDDRDFAGFPARPVVLDAYERADAGVSYALRPGAGDGGMTLFLRVENLFDRDYQEIANFRTPGRSWSVGLRAAHVR